MWPSIPFHYFLEQSHCCFAIPAFRNIGFQNFPFLVDGTPKVMCFAIDLHEDLIKMPFSVGITQERMESSLPDLARKQRTKSVPPITNSFMANINATLMQ